jgi:hypothetical protein
MLLIQVYVAKNRLIEIPPKIRLIVVFITPC